MGTTMQAAQAALEATARKYSRLENAAVSLVMRHCSGTDPLVTAGRLEYAKGSGVWLFELEIEPSHESGEEGRCDRPLIVGTEEEVWLTLPPDKELYYVDLQEFNVAGLLKIPRADAVLVGAVETLVRLSENVGDCRFEITEGLVHCRALLPSAADGGDENTQSVHVIINPVEMTLVVLRKRSISRAAGGGGDRTAWETTLKFDSWLCNDAGTAKRIQQYYCAACKRRSIVLTPQLIETCLE